MTNETTPPVIGGGNKSEGGLHAERHDLRTVRSFPVSTLIAYVMSLFGGIAAGCIAGYVYRYGLSLPFF